MKIKQDNTAWARRLVTLAPYVALFLLFFWPVAMGGLFSGGDLINQYIPWKDFWRRSVWQGDWPLWNPLSFCGMPFQADVQVGQFYPPNWLFLILPAAPCFTLVVVLHFAFGAWGMYRLAGRLADSRGARFAAVATFMFSGYFINRLTPGVVMFVITGAWLPWIVSAAVAWTQNARARDALLLAALLAMQLLSGAPQIFFYTVLAVSLWVVFGVCARIKASQAGGGLLVRRDRVRKGYLARSLIGFLLALALFAALAMVQIWPTWEYVQASFGRAGGASLDFIAKGSMTRRMALTQLVPFLYGDPMRSGLYWGTTAGHHELNAYCGWAAYLLAYIGFAAGGVWAMWRDRKETRPVRLAMVYYCVTLLFVSAALSFGPNLPPLRFVYQALPGFNLFRNPARIMILSVLALSLLAAAGLEVLMHTGRLPDRARRRSRWALALFAGVGLIGLACATAWWRPLIEALGVNRLSWDSSLDAPEGNLLEVVSAAVLSLSTALAWALVCVGAGALALLDGRRPIRTRALWIAVAFGVLIVGDLASYGKRFVTTTPARSFDKRTYTDSRLVRLLERRAKEGGRLIHTDDVFGFFFDQNHPEISCERLMTRGVPQLRGYNPVLLRRYVEFSNLWRETDDPLSDDPGAFLKIKFLDETRLIDVWNARTVLSYQSLTAPGLTEIATISFETSWEFPGVEDLPQDLHVYENANALGEAWLAASIRAVDAPASDVLSVITGDKLDFRHMALVHGEPVPPTEVYDRDESVEIVSRGADSLRLRVASAANRLLVVPIPWFRGWRARVNGEPARVLRVNHAMIGVAMPGGPAEVELDFLPASFVWGGLLSLLAWLAWLWAFLRSKTKQ